MSQLNADTILNEIRGIRQDLREDVQRLHDRLDCVATSLTKLEAATSPHAQQIADLGGRVGKVEEAQAEQGRQLKNVAVVSGALGAGAGALATGAWGWIKAKWGW
jgi:septal ring factor EnvC (AmiA/AmiB activator)